MVCCLYRASFYTGDPPSAVLARSYKRPGAVVRPWRGSRGRGQRKRSSTLERTRGLDEARTGIWELTARGGGDVAAFDNPPVTCICGTTSSPSFRACALTLTRSRSLACRAGERAGDIRLPSRTRAVRAAHAVFPSALLSAAARAGTAHVPRLSHLPPRTPRAVLHGGYETCPSPPRPSRRASTLPPTTAVTSPPGSTVPLEVPPPPSTIPPYPACPRPDGQAGG